MIQQIKKSKASTVLTELINEWADSYIKSIELPIKILKLGQDEGLSKTEIRNLVDAALLKRGLSKRRIREVVPEELKDLAKITDKSQKNKDAAESAASDEDLEIESELKNMANLPVTTPDSIIMKSEAEIAAEQYNKDMIEQQELSTKQADISQLIANKILTEEQVNKWVNDQYLETFQIPKDINITQGAYHARLSPTQAVTQIKQLGNSVKALEIGWKIIG